MPNADSASDRASWKERAKSSTSRDDAHSLSAAARRRLDDHRKADLLRELERFVDVLHRTGRSRHDRHADGGHRLARRGLVAHHANLVAGRPDERDVRRDADVGELGVLGEKAVAGMDRVGAGDLGGGDDARNVEIRLARRRRADADVVVGEAHVQRFAIGLGVDGDRLHAELAAGADDAQRDLAAIGDQDLVEHSSSSDHFVPSASNPDHELSLVPATPCTRSANSAGLVA